MPKKYFFAFLGIIIACNMALAGNKETIITALPATTYSWGYTWSNAATCTGLTVTIVKTDCCQNGTNGKATANVTDGTAPYTYNWTNGGTTQTVNGLTTGTYTVAVTDSTGCTGTASVTLNILPYLISTYSGIGNGVAGFSGDGGQASAAELNAPWKIAFDPNGNLFIADRNNHRIRKINTSGVITTIAGNGTPGFGGDGLPATASAVELNYPVGVSADGAGNVYVADQVNQRIRKIDAAGNINTIAGTGVSVYCCTDGGPADTSELASPADAIADAAGNVYIADAGNYAIRKVNTSGNISKFAGTYGSPGSSGDGGQATAAKLDDPCGLAMDAAGNIYICEYLGSCIRKVNTNGVISTVAGIGGSSGYSGDGGQATLAKLFHPWNIALDNAGNLYIADGSNSRVRMVNTNGVISTVAGNGIMWNSGNGIAAMGDGGFASKAQLGNPDGVAVDAAQNIYVSDGIEHRIRELHACPYCSLKARDTSLIDPSCGGSNGSAEAITFEGIPQYTYSWAPTGGTNPIATGLSAGTYTATVTDSIGCSGSASVTLVTSGATAAITGPDSVCKGTDVTLTASGGTSYLWNDGSTSATITANVTSDSTFSVTVYNGPCNANALHVVYVGTDESICALKFYSGITPNGDGHNDYWQIDNIELFPGNIVEIYNRWGTMVWNAKGYDNNTVVWKGQDSQNQPLPDGTYYYLVKMPGTTYKGWVQLTR